MKFKDALVELSYGVPIKKHYWNKTQYITNTKDLLDNYDVTSFNLEITNEEPVWELCKQKKLHTFEEALKALKEGKSIRRKVWRDYHESYSFKYFKDNYIEYNEKTFSIEEIMTNDWIIEEETK